MLFANSDIFIFWCLRYCKTGKTDIFAYRYSIVQNRNRKKRFLENLEADQNVRLLKWKDIYIGKINMILENTNSHKKEITNKSLTFFF